MIVTAELSYYPLNEDYVQRVLGFIARLNTHRDLAVQTNAMSTLVTGDYGRVMEVLSEEMEEVLQEDEAVFVMKVSKALRRGSDLPNG